MTEIKKIIAGGKRNFASSYPSNIPVPEHGLVVSHPGSRT